MKIIFFIIIIYNFLIVTSQSNESFDLVCQGISSKTKSASSYNNVTGETTGTNYQSESSTKINLSFFEEGDETKGWIQLPSHILPKIKKKKKGNRYDLYNLELDDEFFTAKFKLNAINKPSLSLDFKTGMMEFKGFGISFSGECFKR